MPTPEQLNYVRPINSAPIRHLLDKNHDETLQYVNSLLKAPKSDISVKTYWFPTPEGPGTPSDHTPIQ